ncbi:class III extradiol ring-cleavage dioxygenase family protein [Nocardia aurantia]|uniref:hypothetical protein n=1 Tax=Nocardia aurantia TaxID=2585199 RepID=UPI001294E67A|nr:hypothetical protein [Nocardia aurantia]
MFAAAVLIPSPPVLVPELSGGLPDRDPGHPAAQVPPLRAAVLAAGRELAEAAVRWTVVGVADLGRAADVVAAGRFGEPVGTGQDAGVVGAGRVAGVVGAGRVADVARVDPVADAASPDRDGQAADASYGPGTVGTFRGFGADVRAALSDSALTGTMPADPVVPLPILIGGWLRGQVAPHATADARLIDAAATAEHCRAAGAALRCELDADPAPRGVLIVADGAATLSTAAPGYLDERAAGVQERLDAALSAGDRAGLAALDPALCAALEISGRAAYQVLAGLFDADPNVDTRYCAAPFGVGYHVSVWTEKNPGPASGS